MMDPYIVLVACVVCITALAITMIIKGIAVGHEYYSEVED